MSRICVHVRLYRHPDEIGNGHSMVAAVLFDFIVKIVTDFGTDLVMSVIGGKRFYFFFRGLFEAQEETNNEGQEQCK